MCSERYSSLGITAVRVSQYLWNVNYHVIIGLSWEAMIMGYQMYSGILLIIAHLYPTKKYAMVVRGSLVT